MAFDGIPFAPNKFIINLRIYVKSHSIKRTWGSEEERKVVPYRAVWERPRGKRQRLRKDTLITATPATESLPAAPSEGERKGDAVRCGGRGCDNPPQPQFKAGKELIYIHTYNMLTHI